MKNHETCVANGCFRLIVVALSVALLAVAASAQTQGPYKPSTTAQLGGSVPTSTATSGVLHLTLNDAIARGLKYNLSSVESSEDARIARGQRLVALSRLLPEVSIGASEHVDQVSVSTLGIHPPGTPPVVGPFSYSSADANVTATLFSFESIQRLRAAKKAEEAAQLDYEDALDAITLTVGNAYMQVIEASARIVAQEAQVQNARALFQQALNALNAGTASRIDPTRTEVQLRTEEYNLSIARNNYAIAKLALSRAIGLPLGQQFEVSDDLPYSDIAALTLEDALRIADSSRSDLRRALATETSAARNVSAAKAERLPVITASGDYGDVGHTFAHSHGNFKFQGGVSIPIFTGGRIKGDIIEAEGTLRQRKAEAENLRGQIDYDVRTAFLNVNAAKEQVDVARHNVGLANESLARSRNRFAAGVADSVELVQAEQALASANDQYITSLYNHNFAKLSLARALGIARTNYQQFLGGK